MKRLPIILSIILLLVSCNNNSSSSEQVNIHIDDFDTYVYQNISLNEFVQDINEPYRYEYEGTDIRIENDEIVPLKANSLTKVKLITESNKVGEFEVKVINRDYESKHESAEINEGWFNEVEVDAISNLSSKENFVNGIDISSCKYLYELGAKFYNSEGVEQSLFQILKEHNVNFVRLRLWNDPSEGDFEYGGGGCNLERVKWMAKEAKEAGLEYLLNFHYSDFWADPSYQVVPKAWANFTTVEQFENAIYDYTYSVLEELDEINALPSMVQIGNETIRGLLVDKPGSSQLSPTGNNPSYITSSSMMNSSLAGRYHHNGDNTNLIKYISSGIKAVKDYSSSIQTMIHLAKGFGGYDYIIDYFNKFKDVDYDIIGLSGYAYWHFSNISTLRKGLQEISKAFKDKKICIVETGYGFTYETDPNANNSFSTSSDTCKEVSSYPCSVQGQAKLIRDIINEVAQLENGLGTFYWEGAWVPIKNGGWADRLSKASWANQGFFSYDGKVLPSLTLYQQIYN